VDVTLENTTDCPVRLSLGKAFASKDAASVQSPIRFAGAERVTVSPGRSTSGSVSVPLSGDGTYELTATTEAEIGLVR
jgi:hypothetical protein